MVDSSLINHWDTVYSAKTATDRSWTEESPRESLDFIERAAAKISDPVIDIGGGASLLVDALLKHGYNDVTVLDIAESALSEAQNRLATTDHVGDASFICADITTWKPQRSYAIWHDRAVFHFLTDESDRNTYIATASAAVRTGGHVILATFAPEGPESCSGLPVHRWTAEELETLFSASFELVESRSSSHTTPWGSDQPFTWVLLKRK